MTLPVRAPFRALTTVFLVSVALVAAGCHRAVKPDMGGERTVEAGVPVDFGSEAKDAPVVRWDFGDGTPPQQGARVSHAFPRSGAFQVRALEQKKDEVLGSAPVTVVPRPVLRAMPPDAEVAIFFPQLRGNVEPLVEFASRLLGEKQARQMLEEAPLLSLVLRELRGQPRLVDPEEGVGFFSLPGFEGTVGLLGVMDSPAAMDAVVAELESAGARVTGRGAGDSVRLERESGAPLLLFPDRGYLYLVVPDTAEAKGSQEASARLIKAQAQAGGTAPVEELEAIRTRITGMSGPALSELPLLNELKTKVAAGNVHLFARPVGDDASAGIQGVWAVLRADANKSELEGWVASDKSLFEGKSAPGSELLGQAPAGPIAALMVSIPPDELAKLVFGAPGSERRIRTQQRLLGEGLDEAAVDKLVGALRGDLTLLAYFDAPAFYRNFIQGSRKPEPRGSLLFQAGLVDPVPVLDWFTRQLQGRGQPFEVKKDAGGTHLLTRALSQPVDITVKKDLLLVQGGEPLPGVTSARLDAALHERFGGQAFAPGHLSLMVDVGQLRSQLLAPQVPGVAPEQLPLARGFVTTLLEQLPPVELVFADFAPEQGGGRFRARVELRSR